MPQVRFWIVQIAPTLLILSILLGVLGVLAVRLKKVKSRAIKTCDRTIP